MTPPDGVTVEVPDPTTIVIKGADKQKVGQFAAEVRARPQAGAVQGQGHPVRKRKGSPQGRQIVHQRGGVRIHLRLALAECADKAGAANAKREAA